MRRLLLLFSKPATPGRVKTRLAPELGEQRAAELHAAFVFDVVQSLVRGSFDLRFLWALDDGDVEPPSQLLPPEARSIDWRRQVGVDLGERLFRGLREAARDASFVAAIGSDHPEIQPAHVEDAFRRLEAGADVALGPVPDGGYYLIALHGAAVHERLFDDIPWSTEVVFERTVERCRELGLRWETLAPGCDVDVAEDLDELAGRLADEVRFCAATRALLTRWGRLDKLNS
ncbi:MAG: TIGR04282 family arsenosugar biosynthesis glycosyltransferase [Thermoanaerobaculia bacterium]|nr:TIGR04282 family arsenosugar biosynthesis glycosyltransferase [Thermoanaerobaculia bacterium]